MDRKKWFLSKTVWSGIVAIFVALYNASIPVAASHFGAVLMPIPEWVYGLLGAIGIYSRVTAKTRIG